MTKNSVAWDDEILEQNKDKWKILLNGPERLEVDAAIARAIQTTIPFNEINRDNFRLPLLSEKLDRLAHNVSFGYGIGSIRGLLVDKYSEEEKIYAYIGIASYFGNLRPQPGGGLMDHITDISKRKQGLKLLFSQTAKPMDYHVDSCDMAGLMCVQNAREGGESCVVSMVSIYEEMKKLTPELVPFLFKESAYDRNVPLLPWEDAWFMMPTFYLDEDGKTLSSFYNPQYRELAKSLPGSPQISQEHEDAFVVLDYLIHSGKFTHKRMFERGEIQFVNNLTCIHARTDYVDGDNEAEIRHLYRLWLSPPIARRLPPHYVTRWGSITQGQRGGIQTVGTNNLILPISKFIDQLKPL